MNRVEKHPILGEMPGRDTIEIYVDGKPYTALAGEMIAAALLANGIKTFRFTRRNHKPRGIYCGIGRCTDCIMTVDGVPNVRTCVTAVQEGMRIETQQGAGHWQGGGKGD